MEDAVGGGPDHNVLRQGQIKGCPGGQGNGATQGQLYGGFSEGFYVAVSIKGCVAVGLYL